MPWNTSPSPTAGSRGAAGWIRSSTPTTSRSCSRRRRPSRSARHSCPSSSPCRWRWARGIRRARHPARGVGERSSAAPRCCSRGASLSLPAAVAFGIALSWSWGWVTYSRQLLTEVTACALLLAVLGLVRGVASSHRRALLLGTTLWLAWLARPNLAVLLPAVLLAVALGTGLRGALRTRPLWTLVVSFAVAPAAHVARVRGPLRLRALRATMASPSCCWTRSSSPRTGASPSSCSASSRSHAGEIASLLGANLTRLFRSMFLRSAYLHVGWLALPARGVGARPARRRQPRAAHRRARGAAVHGRRLARLGLPPIRSARRFSRWRASGS